PAFARLKHLTSLVPHLTALRRSDHSSAKLQMEQYAFDLACQGRAALKPREARDFPVSTPPLQKWCQRFNVPDPGPPVDPLEEATQKYIYALMHGLPRPPLPGQAVQAKPS